MPVKVVGAVDMADKESTEAGETPAKRCEHLRIVFSECCSQCIVQLNAPRQDLALYVTSPFLSDCWGSTVN